MKIGLYGPFFDTLTYGQNVELDGHRGLFTGRRALVEKRICHGKPCIKGTRIMVSIILDYLSAGESQEGILKAYPQLSPEDIRGVMEYAAWLVHEEERQPLHTEAAG